MKEQVRQVKSKIRGGGIKVTAALICTLTILSLGAFGIVYNSGKTDYAPTGLSGYMHTVVVDAGHGGIDGGATSKYSPVSEAEINLEIAKKLEKELNKYGVGVVMTRKDENSLVSPEGKYFKRRDMDARLGICESVAPDLLLSVHINKYSGERRRGAQVFYKRNDVSKTAAESVQAALNDGVNRPFAGKDYKCAKGDYYLLNKAVCPAIIVECGFISNPSDAEMLVDGAYQAYLAEVIAVGVLDHLLKQN